MILYTKPYQVIRREGGAYIEGIWQPAAEPPPETMMLNVQPSKGDDEHMIALADPGALVPRDDMTRTPGYVVIVNGLRYIVIAVDRWDSFGGADTAHDRYALRREVPKAPGEA